MGSQLNSNRVTSVDIVPARKPHRSSHTMEKTSLKDLQSLLRSTLGEELIIESYITQDLLPPGENYGSKIISLDVLIKKNKNEKQENLHLVAKLPPPTTVQREMFDSPFTFKKEIFMYSKILPYYRKLEIENGVNENEALNISAQYYGSRLSINSNDFDDDAAILLENLKVKGYYCTDRRYGCDLPHAKLAVKVIARFHALGLATKEKHPDFFQILKIRSKCIEFKNPEEWLPIMEQRLKDIADDPVTKQYYDLCVETMKKGNAESWLAVPSEPWSTIIHADFWANNMMYHRQSNESEPDDIKLVDFQNYLFLSPIRELMFFVACGLNENTIIHIDELIDLYYESVIDRLKILNCDIQSYSRETFDKQIKEDACIEFSHCISMLKIITLDITADNPDSHNVKNLMAYSETNEIYTTRLRNLVHVYADKGWFN